MSKKIISLIASCLYVGYSPVVPGTMVSIAGAGLYVLVKDNRLAYFIMLFTLLFLGFLVCGRAEGVFGRKDSRRIVIDDLCGMLLTFFLIPFSIINLIAGFILFRCTDILKPYPIKRLEHFPGSRGVMFDDILAGIYAHILLRAIQYII